MSLLELVDIGNIAGSRSILESGRIYDHAGEYGSDVCMDTPSHPQHHELISYLQ